MIDIFADTADLKQMAELTRHPRVAGFTTNPTLLRKAGVTDYALHARAALDAIEGKPISFPVLSDELPEMERQARVIASWGPNVYAKIPIETARRESSVPLIRRLTESGVRINITAVFSPHQICLAAYALGSGAPAYLSVFMGRIYDSWTAAKPPYTELWKPWELARDAVYRVRHQPQIRVIWASTRQIYNVYEAERAECHAITISPELIPKLALAGRNWEEFSHETIVGFARDAAASGLTL